nr:MULTISPECIES: DUF2797 domain-containing protein [Parafrankia]
MPGSALTLHLTGPRSCVGRWDVTTQARHGCPTATPVSDTGRAAQCTDCAALDHGRRIATDREADDDRRFGLYLAWFGPGLVKVGLTARGTRRLLEQGALAYTWLAHGRLATIRRAERHLAATGHGRERLPGSLTQVAWWTLPPAGDRIAAVRAAATAAATELARLDGLTLTPLAVVDNLDIYGLDRALPGRYDEVVSLATTAILTGTVTAVIGRKLLLASTEAGTEVLVDGGLLAGWRTVHPPATPVAGGYETIPRVRPSAARQDSLFAW